MTKKILVGLGALLAAYLVKIQVWGWFPVLWALLAVEYGPITLLVGFVAFLFAGVAVADKKLPLPFLYVTLLVWSLAVPSTIHAAAPLPPSKYAPPRPTPTWAPDYRDRYARSPYSRIPYVQFKNAFVRYVRPYQPLFTERDDWLVEHSNLIYPPNPEPLP